MSQNPTTNGDPEILTGIYQQEWVPMRQACGLPIGSGKPDLAMIVEAYYRKGYDLVSQSKVAGADGGDTGFLLLFREEGGHGENQEDEGEPADVGNTKTPAPGLSAVPDATGTAG